MNKPVGVGFIGSQFISVIHARALKRNQNARLIGIASPTPGSDCTCPKSRGRSWTG